MKIINENLSLRHIKLQKRKSKIDCRKNIFIGVIFSFSFAIIFLIIFKRKFKLKKSKFQIPKKNSDNNIFFNKSQEKNETKETNTFNVTNENNKVNRSNDSYRVSIIDGKLIWNNEQSLNEPRVKEEIKEYDNIKLSFENKADFLKRENPLISIVLTLYNQQEFIYRVYASIQKQEFKDIEIIFVDDASTDNSSIIVKELMEKDKRIVYLKNDINRRAFYSRNKGVLNATGKYVIVIDPDDILINNILIKAYEAAEKYNLDIVHFYIMMGYFNSPGVRANLKYKSGIKRGNSEIRNNFYYGISRNIWDKLIKREIFVKSIKFMRPEFYNADYHINDDDTAYFGIIHFAESYGFLEQIGYFYIARPPGPNHYRVALHRSNDLLLSVSNIMKYFYYQSDNNKFEKTNTAYNYFQKSFREFGGRIQYLTEGFDQIIDVFNLYLNSTFFDQSQKSKLNEYKTRLIERQKSLKNRD